MAVSDTQPQSSIHPSHPPTPIHPFHQVNGFLTNTGKAPLCEVRLGVDPTQQYLSIWPRWAQVCSLSNRPSA